MEVAAPTPAPVPKKLIPAQAKLFTPKTEQFLTTSKGNIRIMFGGQVEFTAEEKQKIGEFKNWTAAKPDVVAALTEAV